jgi:hypothetical protein
MPKLGKVENEFNKYRYDVMIHFGKNTSNAFYKTIHHQDFVNTEFLEEYIKSYVHLNEILTVKYIHKILLQDYMEYKKFMNINLNIKIYEYLDISEIKKLQKNTSLDANFI